MARTASASARVGLETTGDLVEALAQIAGLVDPVDHRLADQAAARIGAGERQLLGEMVVQARARGDIGFEIGRLAVLAAAARAAGPGRRREARALKRLARAPRRDGRAFGSKALLTSVPRSADSAAESTASVLARPVAFLRLAAEGFASSPSVARERHPRSPALSAGLAAPAPPAADCAPARPEERRTARDSKTATA